MSFWNLSDNKKLEASTEFEAGGNMEPIPNNTDVLAAIDEAKWDNYEGEDYISLRWAVLAPADYKNRKIFQKLKVNQDNKDKADKAKKMLVAIDTNAGGKLLASGKAPDDMMLTSALVNRPMVLKLFVWEIEGKSGNWVGKVSARNAGTTPPPPPAPAPAIEDEDIGF
jgi:hypothetical protein